jgi:hypothetical protein
MSNNASSNAVGLPAGEFEKIFVEAKVLTDALSVAKSAKSKATKIGNFLALHVGREVAIHVHGRTGKAKLCVTQGRAKQKLYHFEVRWDDAEASAAAPTAAQSQLVDGLVVPAGGEIIADGDARDDATSQPSVINHDGDGGGNAESW